MKFNILLYILLSLSLAGCSGTVQPAQAPVQNEESIHLNATLASDNPFAQKSTLPYGIPDFSKIKPEHIVPALEAGFAQELDELEAIAKQKDEPTFENTVIPYLLAGQLLSRVESYFFRGMGLINIDGAEDIRNKYVKLRTQVREKSTALNNQIFERIEKIYVNRMNLNLDDESIRWLETYYKFQMQQGKKLSIEARAELTKISDEELEIKNSIEQNIRKETSDLAVVVDDVAELDGLSEKQISELAQAAKEHGLDGKYLIELEAMVHQSIIDTLSSRQLRRKIHQTSLMRARRGNDADNNENAFKLAELLARDVNIYGAPTYADLVLDDMLAKTPENVNRVLESIAGPAAKAFHQWIDELQALVDAENGGFKIASYDLFYYANKLKQQKYHIDENALMPYFELENVLENGLFYLANRLYGVTITERKDIPVYHPDVRVFELRNEDGSELALFVADFFSRDGKTAYIYSIPFVVPSKLEGTKGVVLSAFNFSKPADGEKKLLRSSEIQMLFHEFGHALHEMFSENKYSSFDGLAVPRDFVEFPSQLNQDFAFWPEVLEHYAIHYQTGEKLSREMAENLAESSLFEKAYSTLERLGTALIDQKWSQMTLEQIQSLAPRDLNAFEKQVLAGFGIDIDMTPPFLRSDEYPSNYRARYYSYLWSAMLETDAESWFKTHGLTRESGEHFRKTVLSKGATEDCMKIYRDFSGSEPSVESLLIKRGLQSMSNVQ